MFGNLTDQFSKALGRLAGKGKITQANIQEAMDEVRSALLEADVHFEVVEQFVASVTEQALGTDVLESLKPSQLMIKIVHDQLIKLVGGGEEDDLDAGGAGGTAGALGGGLGTGGIMFVEPGPTIIMMAGLQGSGKTTTCGKLAAMLKKQGKSVMLCAADLQRPAAVKQLQVLSEQVSQQGVAKQEAGQGESILCYAEPDRVAEYGKAVGVAVKVCQNALKAARKANVDVLILDTAGRLHINDDLMGELRQINQSLHPHQIYLVIDAMTGQDAVNSAKAFNDQLELDGVILTKFDSDTRGGAALTVKQITGKPIKFIGTGEKLDALEPFHADRIVSRILGMGDVVSLVEKAQEQVSEEEALALQEKMAAGKMTMDDFLKQLKNMRKMGSMKSILGMLPGVGSQIKDLDVDDKQIDQTEAIIHSMTKAERADVDLLDNSRRRRIAKGSGTDTTAVSQLVKGFGMVSQMGKQMSGMGMMQKMKALSGLTGGGNMDMSALGGGGMGKTGGSTRKSHARVKTRKRRSR